MLMMQTTAGFILLANIFNFTLYVTKPKDVSQCYITVDYDKTFNDSYPEKWTAMTFDQDYCKTNLKQNLDKVFVHYKLRYIYPNRSHWLLTNEWMSTIYDMKKYELMKSTLNIYLNFLIVSCSLCLICTIIGIFFCKKLKYIFNQIHVKD